MNNQGFTIEKLYRVNYDNTRDNVYRLRLSIPGLEEIAGDVVLRRADQAYARAEIKQGICYLVEHLKGVLFSRVEQIVVQYGDYDNTAEPRRLEEQYRALQTQQLLNASEAWNQMAANRGMLGRIYGQSAMYPEAAEAIRQQQERSRTAAQAYAIERLREFYYVGHSWEDSVTQPKNPDADKRAMKLLASKIGFRKMRQLKKKGYFEEQGIHGKFRFHLNTQGGVSLIERRKLGNTPREFEHILCVQSMAPDLPKGDVILSRWMEWKADEYKFLDTANLRETNTRDEATQGRL